MTSSPTDPEPNTDDAALEGPDIEVPTTEADASSKPGGLGKDGTIPAHPKGLAAGHTDTASHFNPEEDEDAR